MGVANYSIIGPHQTDGLFASRLPVFLEIKSQPDGKDLIHLLINLEDFSPNYKPYSFTFSTWVRFIHYPMII